MGKIPEEKKRYTCPVEGCGKKISNKQALKMHMQHKHPKEFKEEYGESIGESKSFRAKERGSNNNERENDGTAGCVPRFSFF